MVVTETEPGRRIVAFCTKPQLNAKGFFECRAGMASYIEVLHVGDLLVLTEARDNADDKNQLSNCSQTFLAALTGEVATVVGFLSREEVEEARNHRGLTVVGETPQLQDKLVVIRSVLGVPRIPFVRDMGWGVFACYLSDRSWYAGPLQVLLGQFADGKPGWYHIEEIELFAGYSEVKMAICTQHGDTPFAFRAVSKSSAELERLAFAARSFAETWLVDGERTKWSRTEGRPSLTLGRL